MKKIYFIFIILLLGMMIPGLANLSSAIYVNPTVSNASENVSKETINKTIHITEGTLSSKLTSLEKSTITSLHVTGRMDARDFKTMRDSMPVLSDINIKSVSISAYTGSFGTSATTNTYPENTIPQNAFSKGYYVNNNSLVSIILPNSTASIGDSAFNFCTRLNEITIPKSVKSIGNSAFYYCQGLNNITFPNSVISICDYAFSYCNGLKGGLIIPNSVTSVGEGAFRECSGLTSLVLSNSLKAIKQSSFYFCTGLTGSLNIPNSVTTIGADAFAECYGFTGVLTIPNSVISIGYFAFESCNKFTKLIIPNSVTLLADYAFISCSGLTSVSIPNSITTLTIGVFGGCTGLTSLIIPNSVTSIQRFALENCSNLTSITIPNSVTSIGDFAFLNCSGLTGISIPNSVITIGNSVFLGCTGMKGGLFIPNSVISVGYDVISLTGMTEFIVHDDHPVLSVNQGVLFDKNQNTLISCPSTKQGSYSIPGTVTALGNYAFDYCNVLTSITIPKSAISIGEGAFRLCTGLNSIVVNTSAPIDLSLSRDIFYQVNSSTCTLYVSSGTKSLYQAANQWSDFTNIVEMSLSNSVHQNSEMSPTVMNELAMEKSVIYPNPAVEGFYVYVGEKTALVSIYNLSGKKLFSKLYTSKSYIPVNDLPKGEYIVKITTPQGVVVRTLVKK